MKFNIQREALLKPLQLVLGAVERRQTLPILGNVMIDVQSDLLLLTATDMEIELVARVKLDNVTETGTITTSARKLLDICRNLPNDINLDISLDNERLLLKAGRSRFTLATLSADEFPYIEDAPTDNEFNLQQQELHYLLQSTYFSMAQQDVRYYLNGLLFEIKDHVIKTVATDGHRLAFCQLAKSDINLEPSVIIPRKGVSELLRLLNETDAPLTIYITDKHIRVAADDFTFTSKLVDGRFPDYDRVIPRRGDKLISLDAMVLKEALGRVSILSNEKYRGVRIQLSPGLLKLSANNPEQEQAEEEIETDYDNETLEIAFNVSYLQDGLNAMPKGPVILSLTDANSSLLMESDIDSNRVYVIMPMRL